MRAAADAVWWMCENECGLARPRRIQFQDVDHPEILRYEHSEKNEYVNEHMGVYVHLAAKG